MPRVLFIHSAGSQGEGEGSSAFLAKLRAELGPAYAVDGPLMPNPDAPEARPWLDAVGGLIARAKGPFALVGHSLGGSIILKWLAENPLPGGLVGVVTIAAPFWGARDWDVSEFALPQDAGARLAKVPRIVLFSGRSDKVVPAEHLTLYADAVPGIETATVDGDHEFANGDIGAVAEAIRLLPGFRD